MSVHNVTGNIHVVNELNYSRRPACHEPVRLHYHCAYMCVFCQQI